MRPSIAFVRTSTVGGYLGGHLARLGHDVTLIDAWLAHVETIRTRGLSGGEHGSYGNWRRKCDSVQAVSGRRRVALVLTPTSGAPHSATAFPGHRVR